MKFVNYQISRTLIKQNISELYNYKRTWFGIINVPGLAVVVGAVVVMVVDSVVASIVEW